MQRQFRLIPGTAAFSMLIVAVLSGSPAWGQEHRVVVHQPQPVQEHRPTATPTLDKVKELGRLLRSALDVSLELLSGNEAHLLSGNKADLLSRNKTELLSGNKPKLLSDNQTPILSGNRISLFSNNKIEIRIINSGNNNNEAPRGPAPAGAGVPIPRLTPGMHLEQPGRPNLQPGLDPIQPTPQPGERK